MGYNPKKLIQIIPCLILVLVLAIGCLTIALDNYKHTSPKADGSIYFVNNSDAEKYNDLSFKIPEGWQFNQDIVIEDLTIKEYIKDNNIYLKVLQVPKGAINVNVEDFSLITNDKHKKIYYKNGVYKVLIEKGGFYVVESNATLPEIETFLKNLK